MDNTKQAEESSETPPAEDVFELGAVSVETKGSLGRYYDGAFGYFH